MEPFKFEEINENKMNPQLKKLWNDMNELIYSINKKKICDWRYIITQTILNWFDIFLNFSVESAGDSMSHNSSQDNHIWHWSVAAATDS